MKIFSKRFLTVLLAAAMVFSLSGMTAFAADGDISTYDVGEEPTLNSDGYYEIATPGNLEWFADQVNNVDGQNAINGVLTDDINVSDSEDFSPIGLSSSYSYKGIFNGAGHTVTLNLTDSTASYQALFGHIENATISSVTVDGIVSGSTYVAGVIAAASDSTVIGCVNEAAITSTGNYTGGVVASTDSNITDCGNDGAVTSGADYVGGVAGYVNKNNVSVSGCYNHGAIEGNRTVGGIVGQSNNSITLDSCYNTGAITGTASGGSSGYCSAGIVGVLLTGTVSNVFNTGTVTLRFSDYAGALTGGSTSTTSGHSIINGYYLDGTADSAYAPSGNGHAYVTLSNVSAMTAAEIMSAGFLDLINENNAFVRGADHPVLVWEYEESGVVDKSALQAEYDEDSRMNDIGYTSERWEAFTEALETAKAVLDTPDEELTQLEVDTALYDLQLAKANLNVPLQNADGQYEIANVVTLEWFADQVNGGNNAIDGIVTADIDASASESFSPIGTTDANFTGTFDGEGHTITLNLNDADANYQALFGYTYTAAISNVTVDGSISGSTYVAGIIAYMDASNISGCVNNAAITATSSDVGGVVAYAYTRNGLSGFTNGTIINCGNDGAITAAEAQSVGGIVGATKADGNESTTVSGCYNHADIVGQSRLGGIVGYGGNATSVDSCYNTGDITETGTQTSNLYCSGGLAGMLSGTSPISNSFNTGTVTGGNDSRQKSLVGALLGGGTGTGTSVRLDHVYYLEGSCAYDGEDRYCAASSQGGITVVDDSVSSKTAEELMEIEFMDLVNANLAYTQGTDHPILKWETEERTSYMALREEYQDDLLLDWADYTTESWETFEAVLEAAGELLDDPNATDAEYVQMLDDLREAKAGLVYVDPDYTVKYAVSIYDFNVDKDEDGNTLGLTFGPATASHSYTRTYKAHLTEEEYEAGEGVCLHWMSWKDIVRQSREDPEAFRDCMNNGCTHSVDIVLNDTLLASDYTFNRMTGDGCGVLYYSIANRYLQVDYGNGTYHNYGATTFRTTLNTASYSLLSCFPEDLQNGIVAKKTSYAQTAGSSIAEFCYDKLWLFSLYELGQGGSAVEGSEYYRPTSTNANNSTDNRTYKLWNYYENGDYGDWMLPRSLYGEYDKSIYNVHYDEANGVWGTITGGGSGGLSPGFCLAGPEADQELSAFAVYSGDDSSLTFYTDYTVPTVGSSYNEKAVTAVYTDVDQTVAASASDIPWEDVCTDAASVEIDPTFADAQPTSFAYWFDGFANASFSGLSYMNITDVASMSYMFHDCASLTGLDLSDWNTTGVTDGEEFATGCPNLQWVRIGDATTIFQLSQNVDQQYWYDSRANGNLVSEDYLQDVTEAGTYWSSTEETEGYITIKIGDETSILTYEAINDAISKAETNTFNCGSSQVSAKFVLLSDLIGIDYDFCSYTVTTAGDESVTSGLPTDTYLYKTEDGEFRTAVNDGEESQWISDPDTIEVVVDHVWDVEWTWNGLPLYCTTDNPDFEPLSVMAIRPWNVVESLNIATLAGDTINATATATATCQNCGETETADAELAAAYLSDEPTEYVGALAEITATAAFSDGQKATDAVKVLAPATGEVDVNYLRDDETVKTDSVPYANINELINQTEPFAVHYTASGGSDTYLTMPFVSIADALGMSKDENFCCFTAYGKDDFTAVLPADAYFYQRNQADNSGNNYYYRTAVTTNSDRPTVRSSQAFVSYVDRVDVQYMHQWGTPTWTWSEDHSSATVTVACTRDNGSGMVVCNYSDTVDATIDVTTENGYIVYTATATLVDGTVVTDVQRVEDNREAFAVYSADDNSLTFAYGDAPAVGDAYDGHTVTTVYENVDSVSATSADSIPWYSIRSSVTDVEIDETFYAVQPISLAYWFNEFSSLESLDVSGMDTTNVTEVENFATGCTNLKWVKIGENTDVFRKGQAVVDQQTWYDSDENGKVVSENYLQDVNAAGQYWTCTTYEVPTVSGVEITSNVEGNSKAYDGAGFNLSVSVAAVTPEGADITYQWYGPDGEAIDGANSNVYTTGSNVADSGTYTCTVTATNGTESASADGTIDLAITPAAQEISFADSAMTKTVGDAPFTNTLIVTTVDTEGGATITYGSSDEAIATVDADGEVTILAAGKATITASVSATANYAEASATYDLTIEDVQMPTVSDVKITSDLTDNTKMYDGTGVDLTVDAQVTPDTAEMSCQWYKDGVLLEGETGNVLHLDGNVSDSGIYTCVVTAANLAGSTSAEGTITIMITAGSQEISFAESAVTKTVDDAPFTNTLIETTVDTDGGASISYGSSDKSIATVDETGLVTILAEGEVTITATVSGTANYAAASASYALTIEAAPEPTPVDKDVLKAAIDNAEELDPSNYTEDSWSALEEALATANAVYADDNATQKDVDQATTGLVTAIANLKNVDEEPDTDEPDKKDLLQEYTDATGLSESDYTPESWAPFAEALANARAVLLKTDATQDAIEAAEEALKAAMDNLEKKSGTSGTGGNVKNGLCKITAGEEWGYYVNDVVDKSYTGLAHNDYGDWYVVNGYVHFDQNTVAKDKTGKNGDKGVGAAGTWYYVVGSKVQHDFTGLAHYKNQNGWWYIKEGKVDFTHNGVDKNQNGWWYVKNGKVEFGHNGVDKNQYGWWYITGGKVQFGFTGLADYKNQNGWWYIKEGKVDFSFNGRASNRFGTWNIVNGKVVF